MSAFSRILQPLRRAASAIGRRDSDDTARDEAADRAVARPPAPPPPAAPRHETPAQRREREELARVRADLAAALNAHPQGRQALRPLALVEQTLARRGLDSLARLAHADLATALKQLEGLRGAAAMPGLASLHSRLTLAALERERTDHQAEPKPFRTAAILDDSKPEAPRPDARAAEMALAAAYAEMGHDFGPTDYEMHGELDSDSARALRRPARTAAHEPLPTLALREVDA